MFGMLFEYIANLFCQFFLSGYVAGNYAFPKPLSAQEEREYLRRCKAGDEEARGILIEHNLRLVAHIVKKYSPTAGNDADDLISIGTIGLIKAIDSFDDTKKIRLATYAARCIQKTIPPQRALFEQKEGISAPYFRSWRILTKINGQMYLLYSHRANGTIFMPMYIHTIRLLKPSTNREGEKFNLLYTNPADITNISDKLKYYRYQKALHQKDVAAYIGMDRGTYANYEDNQRDYYPIENMQKIAKLFGVPVTELLDDYNLFLYNGQGQQVKKIRKSLHLTQTQFAQRLGVQTAMVKRWEQGKVRMFKGTWEKMLKLWVQVD